MLTPMFTRWSHNISRLYSKTRWSYVFNTKNDLALGRICYLSSIILGSIVGNITTGIFFTGFLLANHVKIVNIGILSLIPIIANIMTLFTPLILEPFKKRRKILRVSRLIYYILVVACINIIPFFPINDTLKLLLIFFALALGNFTRALFEPGYNAWLANFLPSKGIRMDFFTVYQICGAAAGGLSLLGVGIIADIVANSSYQLLILTICRWVAFALALLEVYLLLSIPKELPYESSTKPELKNIILLPIKAKKFIITMIIIGFWQMGTGVPGAIFDSYLLGTVKIPFTLIAIINTIYPLFLIALSPTIKKLIKRYGMYEIFFVNMVPTIVTVFFLAFVTISNYSWLFPLIRFTQHFFGVGISLTISTFLYVQLPATDRTYYSGFYILFANLTTFAGQLLGIIFVGLIGDWGFDLLYLHIGAAQMLQWLAVIILIIGCFYIKNNLYHFKEN